MFENFSMQNKIISKWSDNFTRFIGRERHRRHYQNVKSSYRASKETIYFLAQIFFALLHYCFQFLLIKLKPLVFSPRCGRFFTMFCCQTYFSWLLTSKLDKQWTNNCQRVFCWLLAQYFHGQIFWFTLKNFRYFMPGISDPFGLRIVQNFYRLECCIWTTMVTNFTLKLFSKSVSRL